MKKKILLFISTIFTCLFFADQAASQDRYDDVEIGFIRAAFNTCYKESLNDIYCSFDYKIIYSDDVYVAMKIANDKDPIRRKQELQQEIKYSVFMWWQPDEQYRFEFDEHAVYEGRELDINHTFSNNNKTSLQLSTRIGENSINARGIVERTTQNKISYPNAIRFGMGVGPTTFDRYFEKKEFEVIGKEIYGDSECYVIKTKNHSGVEIKIWLDTEKDFRSPLMQGYDGNGNLIYESKTIFQNIDGTWFPSYGKCEYYKADSEGNTILTKTLEYEAKDIRVNAGIEPEKFTINFPPGTLINDKILNMHYVIPGDDRIDNKFERVIEILDAVEPKEQAVAPKAVTLDVSKAKGSKKEKPMLVEEANAQNAESFPFSKKHNLKDKYLLILVIGITIICIFSCLIYNIKRSKGI